MTSPKIIHPFDSISAAFMGRSEALLKNSDLVPEDLVTLRQVHGDRILEILDPEDVASIERQEGDALICAVPNIAIAVKTADCVPILIAHPRGVVAAVHAGWRGTLDQILFKTLCRLKEAFRLNPAKLKVYIGPAICQNCYEVDLDVAKPFLNLGFQDQIVPQGAKFHIDLKAINRFWVEEAGVPAHQIHVSTACTLELEEIYHSYRREQKKGLKNEGRNYSWIYYQNSEFGNYPPRY